MQRQLLAIEGPPQPRFHLDPFERALVQFRREEPERIASLFLRLVHGGIGVAHEQVRVAAVVGAERYPHAGAHERFVAVEDKGPAEGGQDLPGNGFGVLAGLYIRKDDGELVTAQTGHRILLAHAGRDALGTLFQQLIAERVPHGVVDLLEMVQVDEQDTDRAGIPPGAGDRAIEPVERERPVGEIGDRVEVRLIVKPLLVDLAERDIHHGGLDHGSAVPGNEVQLRPHPDQGAVLF